MYKLVTIGSHGGLADNKKGAFFNTLGEFHLYWQGIDVISTRASNGKTLFHFFDNVWIHCSPWPKIFQPFFIFSELKKILRQKEISLVAIHEYPPFYNSLGVFLSRNLLKNKPIIFEIYHIVGYPKSPNLKEKFYYFLSRLFLPLILKKAFAVRVINQDIKNVLVSWGVPEHKIKNISAFYLDLNSFRPKQMPKDFDLAVSARLAKNKGIDLLIEAVAIIKKDMPGVKLIIIGDGPEKENLKFKIENLKLKNNVFLYGWAKDAQAVADLLNRSKIFVMPSFNEGGPRSSLEAMACGLPVISTKVGIMKELIIDGENGFFIDWRASDIAEKSLALLKNEKLQKKFSSAGLELVKKFEKKSVIENYYNSYREIIETYNGNHPKTS